VRKDEVGLVIDTPAGQLLLLAGTLDEEPGWAKPSARALPVTVTPSTVQW
jgi:hypothetical protein